MKQRIILCGIRPITTLSEVFRENRYFLVPSRRGMSKRQWRRKQLKGGEVKP